MTPCAFCGEDSQGGTIGHLSSIPAETGILPFCGECEPIRKGSIGFMHPEDFEALAADVRERNP